MSGSWRLAIFEGMHLQPYDNGKFVLALKQILPEQSQARVYFMDNRDVYLVWQGQGLNEPLSAFAQQMAKPEAELGQAVQFINPVAEINELFLRIKAEFGDVEGASPSPSKNKTAIAGLRKLSADELKIFQALRRKGASRHKPVALVVEDQGFSRKLLFGILSGTFDVHLAANAHDGWEMFLDTAPDISFLDIELNDVNGHELASYIRLIAPDTYVVMVTGNNSIDDVMLAKQNKVNGFIAKPFSKQKIIECLEKRTTLDRSLLKGL